MLLWLVVVVPLVPVVQLAVWLYNVRPFARVVALAMLLPALVPYRLQNVLLLVVLFVVVLTELVADVVKKLALPLLKAS